MKITPRSTNSIEIEQDNRSYEIIISDGLLRIKELKHHPKDDRVLFRQEN